ncbi:hypothetical protein AAZX31_09G128400 [Glycine max]|uniref:RING-type E3 ubiquitin transferase n=2 Tax=Glycine subgen. Soja TaxID=1462606 RepID=A0A0R0IEC7_SOYBN|nr:E3 ubiquitin-protein ligase ATL31 [Glycine max]XP_028179945.1 E3 ubiquitin-protein ligase ATL31-like [Glycine soja]KAG5007179.1 hypothetical protein JHK85_025721 [Glycine max]KAG5012961.1 hypothetical protein JHK86_025222 [Glycine max]KAH1042976.1 hypothetical protein GYH30_025019 [Glycine max]KAH1233635.1 E3 ubiquitin-protein ligase ATL6 [Glycine max]KRH38505.1 hypothetical protein GLYMA_09G140800v4 [Glycine max]|eukprot:XP_006587325.1 E3 ubiquitin-protein ligase ATL31 [Glycine max]
MKLIVLFFLVASSSSYSYAQSPAAPAVAHVPSTRATLPMLLVIFLFALLFTAFCSIFIRYCSHEEQPHALPQATRATPRGVDPRVLATCPVTSYYAVKMKTPQKAAFQCAVCLAEFDDADALRLLPKCGHVFHAHCIDAWLAAHVTCPVCRGEVSVEIEGEARARHVFEESSVRGFGVLLRSHSTGHSLERFTLRMPEEVMKKILEDSERGNVTRMMKRSASYDVVLRSMEEGGEGSSNSGSNSKEKSSTNNNNRWVLSMTPPFVSRAVRGFRECQERTVFHCEV